MNLSPHWIAKWLLLAGIFLCLGWVQAGCSAKQSVEKSKTFYNPLVKKFRGPVSLQLMIQLGQVESVSIVAFSPVGPYVLIASNGGQCPNLAICSFARYENVVTRHGSLLDLDFDYG